MALFLILVRNYSNSPVQHPAKFELVLLKTAKALGLEVHLSFQQRPDEVIT